MFLQKKMWIPFPTHSPQSTVQTSPFAMQRVQGKSWGCCYAGEPHSGHRFPKQGLQGLGLHGLGWHLQSPVYLIFLWMGNMPFCAITNWLFNTKPHKTLNDWTLPHSSLWGCISKLIFSGENHTLLPPKYLWVTKGNPFSSLQPLPHLEPRLDHQRDVQDKTSVCHLPTPGWDACVRCRPASFSPQCSFTFANK